MMRASLEAGADLINDVRALTSPGALQGLEQQAGRERPYRNAPARWTWTCCSMASGS
jgi:hypothetical protein